MGFELLFLKCATNFLHKVQCLFLKFLWENVLEIFEKSLVVMAREVGITNKREKWEQKSGQKQIKGPAEHTHGG